MRTAGSVSQPSLPRSSEGWRPPDSENRMAETELKFPEWQQPLREAILKRNPRQLAEKTREVEELIHGRLRQLQGDQGTGGAGRSVEEQALLDALNIIRIVLKDRGE